MVRWQLETVAILTAPSNSCVWRIWHDISLSCGRNRAVAGRCHIRLPTRGKRRIETLRNKFPRHSGSGVSCLTSRPRTRRGLRFQRLGWNAGKNFALFGLTKRTRTRTRVTNVAQKQVISNVVRKPFLLLDKKGLPK